jgi:gliding motility-associated-like protein
MKLRNPMLLAFLGLLPFFSAGQDLSISPGVVSPVAGCYLSANSTVTIIIVNNLGAPYGGTFDVSYTLNGGAPVTESLTTVIPGSGTYIFSFGLTADVSNCQLHNFIFNLAVPGDVNPANNTLNVNIASDCAPVPGTITHPDTVCAGLNSGNMTLVGYTGVIENWIFSDDTAATWTWTGNTTDTQPYLNIPSQQQWWALVGSPYGYCPDDSTDIIFIETIPQTNPGVFPPDFDICNNGNGGTVQLTGYIGDILDWQYSTDNGTTWLPAAPNTTDSITYSNLTDTMMYMVHVQNGICPALYSAPITLTLIPGSDAGSIVGESLVCNFENDSSLEVNPLIGNVVDWYMSTDNGATWVAQGVTDTILPYTGLLTYTIFAAVIQASNCPYDTTYHTIVVLPLGVSAGAAVTIYEEDTTQLMATGGSFFAWFPATAISDTTISNPLVYPMVTTEYFVQVSDINGCVDTASVIVTVLPAQPDVIVPNLLTPNGDGFNEFLNITNIDIYPLNELYIFNAYGQVIYQASPYNNEWAATFNGTKVPDGTYYYILNLNNVAVAPDPLQGVITIIGND